LKNRKRKKGRRVGEKSKSRGRGTLKGATSPPEMKNMGGKARKSANKNPNPKTDWRTRGVMELWSQEPKTWGCMGAPSGKLTQTKWVE